MSFSPNVNRRAILLKADHNINEIHFKDKIQKQRQQQSHTINKQKILSKSGNLNKSGYVKPVSLKDQVQFFLDSARQTKDNINKGFQYVKTIENLKQDQRCLEHNNVITLYCLNDRKLLCVYCIYGVNKHRSHKLLPALEHLQHVVQDVMNLQQQYNDYLLGLDDIISSSKQSTQLFQNLLIRSLSQIQVEYMRRKLELESLYEKQKSFVTKTYESIIEKTSHITLQYDQIKFNIWEYQARYNLDKKLKVPSYMTLGPEQQKNDQARQSISPLKDGKKSIKNTGSVSKKTLKKQKQHKKSVDPQAIELEKEKDFRSIISKHVVLSHIINEMTKIQPIKLDHKNVQKRVINKSNLKLVSQKDSVTQKPSRSESKVRISHN